MAGISTFLRYVSISNLVLLISGVVKLLINDANFNLFPRTVGTDLGYLEEVFDGYVKNIDTVYKDIEFCWEKVNQYYSYESIKKNIEELI